MTLAAFDVKLFAVFMSQLSLVMMASTVEVRTMQPRVPLFAAFVAAFNRGHACGLGGVSDKPVDGTVDVVPL